MARHAIAAEDKEARRQDILEAARVLFNAGDSTLPAAADIAAAAGLAKGTVYLYFRSKEEIFIALLLQACIEVLREIEAAFRDTRGRRGDKVSAFIDAYVGHVLRHPELLRLDSLSYGVLENNLAPDKLHRFKAGFAAELTRTASVIEQALRLQAGSGASLLTRSFALTRGLWQASPSPEPSDPVADRPFPWLQPAFDTELRQALVQYWRGALP